MPIWSCCDPRGLPALRMTAASSSVGLGPRAGVAPGAAPPSPPATPAAPAPQTAHQAPPSLKSNKKFKNQRTKISVRMRSFQPESVGCGGSREQDQWARLARTGQTCRNSPPSKSRACAPRRSPAVNTGAHACRGQVRLYVKWAGVVSSDPAFPLLGIYPTGNVPQVCKETRTQGHSLFAKTWREPKCA